MKRQIELLAPAKNVECGTAAINYGADAVYIGAPKFGARANAGNTLRDIERLAAYAHRYWAKVYVTLNTILFDNELDEARRLAHDVYTAGADALIIQDMALLEMDMPPIPLFASTQTHNAAIDRIAFLEQVGIRRVILARELSLAQIRAIRSATTIEIESFVHGALCVSFSGQCYFSQATQGRSANRGECAQSCRLKYSLEDDAGTVIARDKHLLSLKDLNLSEHLAALLDAGVSSFKIEGRLKDIEYVKNIVAFYRLRLDELIDRNESIRASSSGTTTVIFTPDPERTFNRGTTQYFIRGRKKDIVSMKTPKSIGKTIGTVTRVGRNEFELDTALPIANGDGICYFDENDELQGVNINRVEGRRIFPQQMNTIRVGTVIYRNFDKAFVQVLETDRTARKISVSITVEEAADGVALAAVDEDGVTARLAVACDKRPAQHPERAVDAIVIQLKRSGASIFTVDTIDVTLDDAYYFPASVLNAMRRDLLALLETARADARPVDRVVIEKNAVPYPQRSLDYMANVANSAAGQFYRRHGVTAIEPAFELQARVKDAVIMTTKHCLKFQFGMCEGKKKDMCAADDEQEQVLFLRDAKRTYRLEFDCDACMMKIIFDRK